MRLACVAMRERTRMNDIERLHRSASHRLGALKRSSILEGISSASLSMLAEHAIPARLRKGSLLWQEDEPAARLAYVVRGRLLSQRSSSSGKVVYYHTSKAGELVDYSALVAWSGYTGLEPLMLTHHATVIAREETVVLTMNSSIVRRTLNNEPILARRILWELYKREVALADEIFDERTHSGKLLLATKLLRMAAMEGKSTGRAYLDYSQDELTGFTGLSSRNINKFLGELPSVGTSNGRRGVYIERIETLRAFVHAAAQDL